MFYNNSSKIFSHYKGVILPHSNKVLLEADIDARIAKAKREIDYLTNSLAHRTTHGGKRFRARQISIKNQRDHCIARLKELESARKVRNSFFEVKETKIYLKVVEVMSSSKVDDDGTVTDSTTLIAKIVQMNSFNSEIDQNDFQNALFVSADENDDNLYL